MTIYCGTWVDWVQAIATILLFGAAIVAACYAAKNLRVLREQNRRNTFLSLMVDIARPDARKY